MKKEKIIFGIILVLIVIILAIGYSISNKENKNYDFKIYFFNAGKADAILLSKNNKYMMIDTGEEDLSNEILKYFKENNITRLEYLVITHFDKDHVGSASTIIDNIEIGEVLQSNVPKDSDEYDNYINSLAKKDIEPKTISGYYSINLDSLDITVNGPESIYSNNESNNSSLIVKVVYDNNKFLFMGDAQNSRIKDYLKIDNSTYDFIKVPYHGNYQKRLDDLFESIKPKSAVMTCSSSEGCENETIELLNNYNIKYYSTKNGSISILSDGNSIKINQ